MDDLLAEIKYSCEYSSSQEDCLRHYKFYGESAVDPEDSSSDESTQNEGIPVDSTGITMFSQPVTPNSQSEEFLTPQENLLMSSQEQAMNLTGSGADDHEKKLKSSGDVSTDPVETVDLGKNSDPRFSPEKSPAEKGLFPGKGVLGFPGESSSEKQGTAGEVLGGAKTSACGARVDNGAERTGEFAFGGNLGLRKRKIETVSLQYGGFGGDIPVDKESAGAGLKENATMGVAPLKATDKGTKEGGGSSSNISQGRSSEMPASIRGLMQNAANRFLRHSSSSENQSFQSLLDIMATLPGEQNATTDLGEVDILEIVEKRGMTPLPRPRWWKQLKY